MAGRVFFPIFHCPLPIGHSLGPVGMEVGDKSIPHPRPESQELAIIGAYLSVGLPHLPTFDLVLQNNSQGVGIRPVRLEPDRTLAFPDEVQHVRKDPIGPVCSSLQTVNEDGALDIKLRLKSSRLIQLLLETGVMGAKFSRMCLPGIDKYEVEPFVLVFDGKFLHSRPGYATKRSGQASEFKNDIGLGRKIRQLHFLSVLKARGLKIRRLSPYL